MLIDAYSRIHDYLRVSITDRCNLRCSYCMPPDGIELISHDEVLRNEEFARLVGIFASLGVAKVRFTGGEPLLRKGFTGIIERTRALTPGLELCLTTNGIFLKEHACHLMRLGVRKLNISLDSLSRDTYRDVTGSDMCDRVIGALEHVLEQKYFNVKVNAVLFEHTLRELDDFLEFFKDRDVTLRFIEKMPFANTSGSGEFVPSSRLTGLLAGKGELARIVVADTAVARMYDFLYRGRHRMRIGIIPTMSDKFCSSCNRLRLTSEGLLKTCLHSGDDYNLKRLLRGGADDESMRQAIVEAVRRKHEAHALDCGSGEGGCASVAAVGSMSRIGG